MKIRHVVPLLSLCIAVAVLSVSAQAALVAQYTFNAGEELTDRTGNFGDIQLRGDATISGGQLDVNGSGTNATGWAASGPYTGPTTIGEKTLVSWVTLQSLQPPNAGSALTLDSISGDVFDGIIFAERDANRWMNGSNGFVRTSSGPGQFTGGTETGTGQEIQMAISYQDLGGGQVRITGYRNGAQIGQYDSPNFATWSVAGLGAEVMLGKRHGDPNTNSPGGLDALINEVSYLRYGTFTGRDRCIATGGGHSRTVDLCAGDAGRPRLGCHRLAPPPIGPVTPISKIQLRICREHGFPRGILGTLSRTSWRTGGVSPQVTAVEPKPACCATNKCCAIRPSRVRWLDSSPCGILRRLLPPVRLEWYRALSASKETPIRAARAPCAAGQRSDHQRVHGRQ